MKGYVILVTISVLICLLVPLCAISSCTPPTDTPPLTEAPPTDETAAVFRVKNEQTGEITAWDEQAFIIAIVSCEMAASSPAEALKAQAVAAYTYYIKQRAAAKDGVFSNVPDTFFTHGTTEGMKQRWGDAYEQHYTAVKQAAEAVKGQKIVYQNEPITACYHAISAGLTERAADVWGGDYPYLIPVDSVGDLSADGYETTASFTPTELLRLLQKKNAAIQSSGETSGWFSAPDTTDSGFVKSITFCNTSLKGTAVREALGLRSACFTVRYEKESFVFTVRGYGHNVGMSQTGAKYMAANGASYLEILSHYYPGTVVV